jgi:hypothetical protein
MSKPKIAMIIIAFILLLNNAFAQTLTVITSSGDVQINTSMETCAKFDYKPGDIVSYSGIPGIILGEAYGNLWIAAAAKVYQITDTTRINKLTKYPDCPCYIKSRRPNGTEVRLDISHEATKSYGFYYGDRVHYPGWSQKYTVIGAGDNSNGDMTLHMTEDSEKGVLWHGGDLKLVELLEDKIKMTNEDSQYFYINTNPDACFKAAGFKPRDKVRFKKNPAVIRTVVGIGSPLPTSYISKVLWLRNHDGEITFVINSSLLEKISNP